MNYAIQGLSDTSKDKESLKFKEYLNMLKLRDSDIEVLNYKVDVYGASPKRITYLMNTDENNLVKEMSNKKLPIVFINDQIFKYGEYPTMEEIKDYMQVNS